MSKKCKACGRWNYYDHCPTCERNEKIKQKYSETVTIDGKIYPANKEYRPARLGYKHKIVDIIDPELIIRAIQRFSSLGWVTMKDSREINEELLSHRLERDSTSDRNQDFVIKMLVAVGVMNKAEDRVWYYDDCIEKEKSGSRNKY